MAGEKLKGVKITGAKGRVEQRSDFPTGNAKGQGKHKAIRQDWMKAAYSDGKIDYYGDKKHWNKIFDSVGQNTNLKFNRVKNTNKADIINFTGGKSHEFERTTPITGGSYKGQEIDYKVRTTPHGYEANTVEMTTARGLSTAYNPKELSSSAGNLPVNDYFQTNTVGKVVGLPKEMQWNKAGTAWHEVGHSLGLAGDYELPVTDKSVMSYNSERQTEFDKRDYKAINKFWKPYTSGKAYK